MDELRAREAFQQAINTYEQNFETFFLARLFGLQFEYEGNKCFVEFNVEEFMHNPQGTLHGGIIAFVLDVSMGHNLRRLAGPAVTLEMKVQYLKPVRKGKVRVTGELVKRGREICFLRADMHDVGGSLIATATSTWKLL